MVKVLYGLDAHSSPMIPIRNWSGPWNGITRMLANLKDRGLDFETICPIRIRDGANTFFWHEVWIGDTLLVVSFYGP